MSEPTYQDAQLMIQMAQWWSTGGLQKKPSRVKRESLPSIGTELYGYSNE